MLKSISRLYREFGVLAVLATIVNRLRLMMGGDLRPMVRYNETENSPPVVLNSDLSKMFDQHEGNLTTKWRHYSDIYETHFSRFRGTKVRMLEIGVFKGGSLDVWRKYLGPEAVIFGIDIEPKCAEYDGISGSVRIGSQTDTEFVNSVVDEMGGVDLVLDDGSHESRDILATLKTVFPRLSDGGVYMIEDLHCAYLPRFGGGHRWPGSFMTELKTMIDDMHHWYHKKGERNKSTAGSLRAIHVYDSIVALDKQAIVEPVSFQRPRESAE